MTKDEMEKLRVGDIVEFDNGICYWLAKLVGRDNEGDWKVRNHGKTAVGITGTSVRKNFENLFLVGHSDAP